MNNLYPIYTLQNECHDCYKCIRQCNVKAIKINNGHASVIPDKCIACGHCVILCPQKAKKVRNDIEKAKNHIKAQKKVYVSLAPSWSGVFDATKEQMITALQLLGFEAVSETAIGAQEVSIETARVLSKNTRGLFISSACPAIVDYIRLYNAKYTENIVQIASPALTHAKQLKEIYGDEISVVFIGPCIAKKTESDRHSEVIDVCLTFEELNFWLEQECIDLNKIEAIKCSKFIPEEAYEGGLYPLEGGMNKTLQSCNISKNVQLMSVSSIKTFEEALQGLDVDKIDMPIFIEALACDGGCVNGPGVSTQKSGISIMSNILTATKYRKSVPKKPSIVFEEKYVSNAIGGNEFSIEEILDAMQSIGKHSVEDELNCGGCGYDTCRQLAKALLLKEAEPHMCTSYMRKIATKKAGAMLRFMPSGIVMVDANLKIIETNEAFIKMFAGDLYEVFKNRLEGIAGASIDRVFPCADIFKSALRSGSEVRKEHYPINGGLYDITAFTIEKNQIVGAVITDVTKTEMRRDQIAKKAQDVINKNITIVQDIACMLGEHMVDTELLLSSIAEGYETCKEVEE